MTQPVMHFGDCIEVMREMEDESIHACVTDPPYSLGFMGKKWDRHDSPLAFQKWCEEWAREVLRILKPGGHLIAFGGTRTYHRLACAAEDAGFEVRDSVHWLYGCLSDDTEILINGEWEPHHKATTGSLAMCYNVEHDEYSWQPIQERVVYDYADTAYRIQSDHTDQIVSRNHRCIVEHGGRFTFRLAEEAAREREARVPILEDLPGLLRAVPVPHQGASAPKQDVQQTVCERSDRRSTQAYPDVGAQAYETCRVLGMREESLQADGVAEAGQTTHVLKQVQRRGSGPGMGEARAQGPGSVDRCEHGVLLVKNDRRQESCMEGRGHVLPQTRQLQADQVCPVPTGVFVDGAQRRICDGAQTFSRASNGSAFTQEGNGASRQPRPAGQRAAEPATVRDKSRSQTARAQRHTSTDLARVTPFEYRGIMWCVRVPTGAFVARRNGKVFVTGNSGFPKSLDVSKAIDAAAGAEREVVGTVVRSGAANCPEAFGRGDIRPAGMPHLKYNITAPATPAAKQWDGWGTALKPAHEIAVLARKPLTGTVAQNVLEHGCGGLNIDACRIPTDPGGADDARLGGNGQWSIKREASEHTVSLPPATMGSHAAGRFPANVIHDGSDAVLGEFAKYGERDSGGPSRRPPSHYTTQKSADNQVYGDFSQNATPHIGHQDTGTAARFFKACPYEPDDALMFYTAKASKSERDDGLEAFPILSGGECTDRVDGSDGLNSPRAGAGRGGGRRNHHPTVKPIALMRYLCRLVTPPGGIVLDPFAGSGTTLIAAYREGFRAIGIERDEGYFAMATERVNNATAQMRLEL